jgi:hypothetical protein
MAAAGSDLTGAVAYGAVVEELVVLTNSSSVSFINIDFRHSKWSCGTEQV